MFGSSTWSPPQVSVGGQRQEREEESQERPVSRQEVMAERSLQVQEQVSLSNCWSLLQVPSCCLQAQEQEVWSSTSSVAHSLEQVPPPRGQRPSRTGILLEYTSVNTVAARLLHLFCVVVATQLCGLWHPPLHLLTVTCDGVIVSTELFLGQGTATTFKRTTCWREKRWWLAHLVPGLAGSSAPQGPADVGTSAGHAGHCDSIQGGRRTGGRS